MARNEVSKILAYIRKHQNHICIKLGIAIFVCFVLCFACFFVERQDDDDIGQNDLQDDRHSTEKLIQIKLDKLYEQSNPHKRADISLQSQNDFDDESSGNYLETTEFYLVPQTTSSADEIFESALEEDISHTKTDTAQATSDLQEMIEVLNNNSGEFIEKNTIEKLFENLPKYSETQTQNLLAELNNGHLTTDAAQGQYRRGSALKRNFDFEKKDPMASRNFDHNEPYTIETGANEDERYFPNEYAFDEDAPEEDSAEDESDEEFIFTDYDNGDYMELREHQYSEEGFDEEDAQIPSLIDSLFGKMSTLLTPMPMGKQANFASPMHGLSNFKDSLLKNDHLQVESSYVPIWQPHLDNTALNQFWNPKKPSPKPPQSELRSRGKNHLPVLNNWFKVPPADNRYSNQMENSFKMFQNFFNPKKS